MNEIVELKKRLNEKTNVASSIDNKINKIYEDIQIQQNNEKIEENKNNIVENDKIKIVKIKNPKVDYTHRKRKTPSEMIDEILNKKKVTNNYKYNNKNNLTKIKKAIETLCDDNNKIDEEISLINTVIINKYSNLLDDNIINFNNNNIFNEKNIIENKIKENINQDEDVFEDDEII